MLEINFKCYLLKFYYVYLFKKPFVKLLTFKLWVLKVTVENTFYILNKLDKIQRKNSQNLVIQSTKPLPLYYFLWISLFLKNTKEM